ncbi:metallo-beta-lactamase superfamily protein [Ceratobasidium sp. AG-Ba]|nr:metallo-beta-lactamase superfamily protein [Ceratobasidium sp. AG-Ba]
MSVFSARAQACGNDPEKLHIELYGPPGLRQLVRTTLTLTHMKLSGKYVVHELHPLDDDGSSAATGLTHPNELVGRDMVEDGQGFWEDIANDTGFRVNAGVIEHRVFCVGYVFTEKISNTIPPTYQSRRIVCLGDTSSAEHIVPLCISDDIYPSLVVHEATNAWIPPRIDQQRLYGGARKTPQSVREKAISKGHSTPDMAGAFARSVKAERLALTHFSAMQAASFGGWDAILTNTYLMREIARQATVSWGRRGARAIAAHDLSWIDIPQSQIEDVEPSISQDPEELVWEPEIWDEPLEPDQTEDTTSKRKWDGQHGEGRSRGSNWKRGRGRGRGGRGRGRDEHMTTN